MAVGGGAGSGYICAVRRRRIRHVAIVTHDDDDEGESQRHGKVGGWNRRGALKMIMDSVFFFCFYSRRRCFYDRRRRSHGARDDRRRVRHRARAAVNEATDAEEAQLLLAGLPAPDAGDSSAEEGVVKLDEAKSKFGYMTC